MKPQRTFGLSLAILASIMLFSILPLLQVSVVVLLQARLQNAVADLSLGENEVMAFGGDFTGVSPVNLILQTVTAVAFLVVAVLAWRGRPRGIRLVMLAAVLTLTLLHTAITIAPLLAQPTFAGGIDAGADIARPLLWGRLLITLVIPLYVVWYMNRGPARAFYRGYYLPEP